MGLYFKRNKNVTIIIRLLLAFFFSFVFVLFMDYDLLKTLYELYYGDSEVAQFFKDAGENVFTNSIRVTSFKLVLYRAFYSILPIMLMLFLSFSYGSKKLPDKCLDSEFFKKNDSMGKILMFCRYAIGAGVAFLFLMVDRTFYFSTFHNCLLGRTGDFFRIIFACLGFLIFTIDWKLLFNDCIGFSRRHPRITIFVFMCSILSCRVPGVCRRVCRPRLLCPPTA